MMKAVALLTAGLLTGLPSFAALTAERADELFDFREGYDTLRVHNAVRTNVNGKAAFVASNGPFWIADATGRPNFRPVREPARIVIRTQEPVSGRADLRLLRLADRSVMNFVTRGKGTFVFDLGAVCRSNGLYRLHTFTFAADGGKPCRFAFASAEAYRPCPSAETVDLDVRSPENAFRVLSPGRGGVLTLSNASDASVSVKGRVKFRDFFDRGFDMPVSETLGGRETVERPFAPVARLGHWRVTAELTAEDGSKAAKTATFAVLAPHPVTPRTGDGVFRTGVNFHAASYFGENRRLGMDVLNRIGAKLARIGTLGFGHVMPSEGTYDWSLADEIVGELLRRGIDVNANVFWVPLWAATPEKAGAGSWIANRSRPRHSLFRDYCRAAAARYGTRVAYYEVGNEWDLFAADRMTPEEAVEVQREAYAGLKAGCPAARVTTNGFALPDSDCRQVTQKGFQETMVSRARDAMDVHAIHLHGGFADYESMCARFFALRAKAGAASVPWFANETALTSVLGKEDEAAACVWQKMAYSRAHGSTDYCWYNLRGTGWEADDHEQGYGLVSADWRPRATLSAFSSFVTVTEGFDRGEPLFEQGRRRLYAFASPDARLWIGWDDWVEGAAAVKVTTDAVCAEETDLMGNVRILPVADGMVTIALTPSPRAWTFRNATRVEANATDLARVGVRRDPRMNDFTLDRIRFVKEVYPADPLTAHRCWKGPSDCSARVQVRRTGPKGLSFDVFVTDDRAAAEDGVEISFQGWKTDERHPLPRLSRTGAVTRYGGEVAEPKRPYERIRISVIDDDGEGEDLRLEHWFLPETSNARPDQGR